MNYTKIDSFYIGDIMYSLFYEQAHGTTFIALSEMPEDIIFLISRALIFYDDNDINLGGLHHNQNKGWDFYTERGSPTIRMSF